MKNEKEDKIKHLNLTHGLHENGNVIMPTVVKANDLLATRASIGGEGKLRRYTQP